MLVHLSKNCPKKGTTSKLPRSPAISTEGSSINSHTQCQACISILPLWRSVPARRRFRKIPRLSAQACPPFRGFGNEPGVYLKETPQCIVEKGVMPSFAESQRDHVVWNLCRSYDASYRFTKSGQNQTSSSSAGAKAEVDLRRASFGVVFLPPTQWTSERTRKTCHKCIEGSKAVGAMHSESQCLFAASPLHESVYEPMALLHPFEDHLGVGFFFIPSVCEVGSMVKRP